MIINNPDAPEHMKGPPVPEKNGGGQQQSQSQNGAPAPPLVPPPPYTPRDGPSQPPQRPPMPQNPSSISRPQLAQTVNHFELFSKHDSIWGTYNIDPTMSSPMLGTSRKLRRKHDSVWGKKSRCGGDINASFRTRHGAINLDLSIVSNDRQAPSISTPQSGNRVPARIVVSSRHGRINTNVHEVQPGRCLDLQVESRHGKITILLPPTFDGPLVFNARSVGAITFLPAFAARSRTIRATDRETVVLCRSPDRQHPPSSLSPGDNNYNYNNNSGPKSTPAQAKGVSQLADECADRCLVRTRHGRVVVGISGLDVVEEPVTGGGLFRTLGRFVEAQGRAFGQYVESQAKTLEKNISERSAALAQHVDEKAFVGGSPRPAWSGGRCAASGGCGESYRRP